MRLLLVRHGQTEHNKKGIVQGHLDVELNEKGIEQAKYLAERLRDESLDIIYSSDLVRAKRTAEEIKKYHRDVPIEYTSEIREIDRGSVEGKPAEVFFDMLDKYEGPDHLFSEDGGETLVDFYDRVKGFYDRMLAKHLPDDNVLVVAHGGTKRTITLIINGENYVDDYEKAFEDYNFDNTSITVAEIDEDEKAEIHLMNCTEHL